MIKYWLPLSLALSIITSLLLRILPPFHQIFTPLGIKFAMNDAYYHMRLIDNLVYNFPHFSFYDPYFVFPGTTVIGGAHFFDWLIASIVWIVGLGSPTQMTIDVVGVYLPPIMAALVVIPVYFIGKSVFNRWVGLVGALLIAILPGEFLGRSILGAADHHVAEVLFSMTAIMFFVLAIKSVSTRRIGMFTILAGLFLGIYLLTWLGGLLFVLIISLFLVIQIIRNHLRGVSSTRIAVIATTMFAIMLLMNYSNTLPKEVLLALGLAVILPVALATLSWLMLKRNWHLMIFPSIIAVSGILFLVAVNWLYPSFTSYLGMFLPSGSTATTTLELQPMLFPQGQFTWLLLWGNFTTTVILAPIALAILAIVVIKDKSRDEVKLLLVIWPVVMIALMLNQRRYAYYAAINVSLLAGYLAYVSTRYFTRTKEVGNRGTRRRAMKFMKQNTILKLASIGAIIALALVPMNLSASIQTARYAIFAPSNAWQSAMLWIKDNTPEPFESNLYDNYLPLLAKDLPEGEVVQEILTVEGKPYPEYLAPPTPSYTVSAWWDYGYWITRIGHRVPNANPAQNTEAVKGIADLFLSEGNDYRNQINMLKSEYIVLDNDTAFGKFYAVVSWGGKDSSEYFGVYRVPDGEGYRSVMLFYPEYYKTLVSRLYNSNGEAVVPERTVVITYKNDIVLEAKQFIDYWEAQEYVDNTPGTRIVSADPRISPVPLEEVDYGLVYESKELVNGMPEVKIFEYTGEK